ncbi:MAG: hypothetical protein GWP08_09560 [Nitrospiraceae bacterium]|nr:hypothetical protein [Nitrospiraceae bacterium]
MKLAYRPVVAYCRNHSDAFFEGQEVVRDLVIMNDTLEDVTLELRATATCAGREVYTESKLFPLPAGELAEHTVAFTAPRLSQGKEFTFCYDLWKDGVPVEQNERTCRLFARKRIHAKQPVYYLADDAVLARVANSITGEIAPLKLLAALEGTDRGILLLRESSDGVYDDASIRQFLENGGAILFFAEDPAILRSPSWLDLPLSFPTNLSKEPPQYCIAFKSPAVSDPVLEGLADTDFISTMPNNGIPYGDLRLWGSDNLIAKKCVAYSKDPSFRALVRATSGALPRGAMQKGYVGTGDRPEELTNVLLARITQGKGTVVYSTLLLSRKFEESPQAAKVLSLLLEDPT